jgi:acyl carrier protein
MLIGGIVGAAVDIIPVIAAPRTRKKFINPWSIISKGELKEILVPIPDHIMKVLAEELAVDESEIVEEAYLMGDLDADSLNLFVIYSKIETIFGVIIEDDARPEIQTVGDLVEYVKNKEE